MTDRDAARELSDSLDQVLELDAHARAAWLAELGCHRPDLAAKLRELLAGAARR